MTHGLKRAVLGLACLLVFSAWSAAQTETATLSGTIKDATGAVIPGVQVQVVNQETNVSVTMITNGAGVYVAPPLKPGPYRIVAAKQGFKQMDLTGLRLNVQDVMTQDLTMQVGAASESITVMAEAERVNTTDASVGTVIERRVVADMPLNGRSFQGLITLTPGVSTVAAASNNPGQFVVNGQRSDTSYFSVDGVSANVAAPVGGANDVGGLGAAPATTISGGFNNMVSLDALQEFRITTSSFAPEFGRTPGGQISIVSRSGTNGFHGDVFDYFRNTVLDANDWFLNLQGKPRGVVQQNDFGGVAGGPIVKNRTFFFFSYEGLRLRSPSPSVKSVPTQAARNAAAAANANGLVGYMAQFLNAYPLPDGNPATACTSSTSCFASFTGSFPGISKSDTTAIRIDHSLTQRATLFGRYSHSPSSAAADSSVTTTTMSRDNDTYTAGWTQMISSAANNDLRFNFSHTTFVKGVDGIRFKGNLGTIFPAGYAQPPSSYDQAHMTLQFGTGIANYDTLIVAPGQVNNGNDQWNITDSFSVAKGRHSLKFGADVRQLTPSHDQSNFNWNNSWALTIGSTPNNCPGGTVPGYICGIASLSNIQHNVPQHFQFREWSFFGQDTWKATQRLTLTYGARYEVNPAVGWINGYPGFSISRSGFDLANIAAITLNPFGTPAYPTSWGNVSPRLGAAYRLSANPKWGRVLRLGYGLFYDTGNQVSAILTTPWNARFNNGTTPVPFPISTANAAYVTPPLVSNPPIFPLSLTNDTMIDPNFKLPQVHQMNVTVEQQLGRSQSLTVAYVGARGRRLLGGYVYPPNKTNPKLLGTGTTGDTYTILGNYATSSYNSLQTKFQRQFSHGLAAVASYTWSHSIDTNSGNQGAGSTLPTAAALASAVPSTMLKASSNFDLRHNFSMSLVYDIPAPLAQYGIARAFLAHWSVDPIYHYQGAGPPDVMANATGTLGGATGLGQRPNLIPGVPVYVYGSDCAAQHGGQGCPGGFGLNAAAVTAAVAAANGCVAPTATNARGAFCTPLPVGTQAVSGNVGRNVLRGFPLQEFDFSLHRDFPMRERFRLRFQADMFNVFNHPQFSGRVNTLNGSPFGIATSMANTAIGSGSSGGGGFNPIFCTGGPRNFQFALKLFF
jgi:hypothetical protein